MSKDTPKSEFVGVRLTPEILAKIDERAKVFGGNRQDVIKDVLINELF